jgi:hypothetical protein
VERHSRDGFTDRSRGRRCWRKRQDACGTHGDLTGSFNGTRNTRNPASDATSIRGTESIDRRQVMMLYSRCKVARRTAPLLLPIAGLMLSLAHLTGCASTPRDGYAAVSPYPSKYRSVAVPIFRNQSYMRGFELDLADAVVKEVESSTPYKVRSEATADTVLRGTLTAVDLIELSKDPSTGLANEMMVRVRADFEWVDLRTGERIVAKQGIESSALFVPSYPAREPLELGRFAAVQQLAHDLVGAMQSNW